MFTARAKFYFNTPEMMRRLGKWRNDLLAATGAYGRGVFRNKLGRPQLKQTKDRTVLVAMQLRRRRGSGRIWNYHDTVFVPRRGLVRSKTTGRAVPKAVARFAMSVVSSRLKGQGAGRPPRMGPTKKLRRLNDFALDSRTETVVIGTVPFKSRVPIAAASVPNLLDEGLSGWINNSLIKHVGAVFTQYAKHPYVESVVEPTQRKLEQLIRRRQAGS